MRTFRCRSVDLRVVLVVFTAVSASPLGSVTNAAELNMRPIVTKPEPLKTLHPKLQWMKQKKVRAIWIGDDLFEQIEDDDKTKGQVLRDTGFNLVRISMTVNSDNTPSGVVDTSQPLDVKHDRSKSSDIETRLAPNIKEARRRGLTIMIGFQYGTHHLEPYRKFRSTQEGLANITCCPVEKKYISGQHVGKWAIKIAKGGADGMVIDMEMYHSDKSGYHGSCVCNTCFATYLKKYATNAKQTYRATSAESRAQWLQDQNASDHYASFAARRIEALYDSIRRRCQKINPAFFFGIAPMLHHLPGVERGLGSAAVPCLVFSEHEYHHGTYRGSFISTAHIRKNLPALFVSGAYVTVQTPAEMATNVVQSSLYTDGWWPWYGTSLLTNMSADKSKGGEYSRVKETSARDYLDRIAAAHTKLDQLLAAPKNQWPDRQDGKLNWLQAKVANAKDAKTLAEAQVDLENYRKLLGTGGY